MKRKFTLLIVLLCLALSACAEKTDVSDTRSLDRQNESALVSPDVPAAPSQENQQDTPTLPEEKPDETMAADEDAPSVGAAWIVGDNVNFRSGASRESEILTRLADAQEVALLAVDGDWACVELDGMKGYVFAEYISSIAPALPNGSPAPGVVSTEDKNSPSGKSADVPIDRTGLTIAIDPGHQRKGNSEREPIGPGAKETKAKVSSGTSGVSTQVPEYQLTLDVSLKLRDELVARGYNVVMIRETHDVNISNKERAAIATDADADIFVRIHADGSENSAVNGILTLSPTENTRYIPDLYEDSYALSKCILDAMVAETEAKNRGVLKVDTMSGINWSTMPVTIVEMGLMTNPAEDELMQTEDYQLKLAIGIANGIDHYFSAENEC